MKQKLDFWVISISMFTLWPKVFSPNIYFMFTFTHSTLFFLIRSKIIKILFVLALWRRGVVVITTAQLHPSKPGLRFRTDSNSTRGVSEICDGEDLCQWSQLEIRLHAFRRSTIPQKQFIINLELYYLPNSQF